MQSHRLRSWLLLGAVPLCLVALSRPTRAQEPGSASEPSSGWAHAGSGSIFLQGVWGINADSDDYVGFADHTLTSKPYAFGIGARAGYTFPFKLYIGARA